MEGFHTVKALLKKEDWMTKIDLKFGQCTVLRVFTKTLKSAKELLQFMGIRMVVYMDYMLLMASSKQMIQEHMYVTIFLLENLDSSLAMKNTH